eukprot:4231971-Pleurochrysis_carterae.AAC.1
MPFTGQPSCPIHNRALSFLLPSLCPYRLSFYWLLAPSVSLIPPSSLASRAIHLFHCYSEPLASYLVPSFPTFSSSL